MTPSSWPSTTTPTDVWTGALSHLPDSSRADLLRDAWVIQMPALSTWLTQVGARQPAIVMIGTVRVYLSSSVGRQIAILYATAGSALGFGDAPSSHVPSRTEAVTPSALLRINPVRLERLIRTDPAVASMVADELARQLDDTMAALSVYAFGSIRQRAARHLLYCAQPSGEDGRATVAITHQQIADSIGSVREVVGRALRELGERGLIEVRRGCIELRDIEAIRAAARLADPPTRGFSAA